MKPSKTDDGMYGCLKSLMIYPTIHTINITFIIPESIKDFDLFCYHYFYNVVNYQRFASFNGKDNNIFLCIRM